MSSRWGERSLGHHSLPPGEGRVRGVDHAQQEAGEARADREPVGEGRRLLGAAGGRVRGRGGQRAGERRAGERRAGERRARGGRGAGAPAARGPRGRPAGRSTRASVRRRSRPRRQPAGREAAGWEAARQAHLLARRAPRERCCSRQSAAQTSPAAARTAERPGGGRQRGLARGAAGCHAPLRPHGTAACRRGRARGPRLGS